MDLGDIGSGMWSAYSWLRIGSGGGSCECGDDPSDSSFTEVVSYILLNRAWLVGGGGDYWGNSEYRPPIKSYCVPLQTRVP
jgi:hypothetical protein